MRIRIKATDYFEFLKSSKVVKQRELLANFPVFGFVFFCLNFVIKGVPEGAVRQGGIPGCSEGVLGMFRRCSEPVPSFGCFWRYRSTVYVLTLE